MPRTLLSMATLGLALAFPVQAETHNEAALARLRTAAASLRDARLRDQTLEALSPQSCVRHRADLTAADEQIVMTDLRRAGFLPSPQDETEAETQRHGVFPPVDGGDPSCPRLPQPLMKVPGGNSGSHHDWPGGLVDHEAFNLDLSADRADLYEAHGAAPLDRDVLTAAVLWHDWAKALVFVWRDDGGLPPEIRIADAGAHHVLGLAESMARDLPPAVIAAQACAHRAPVGDDRAKVEAWLEAAALIARKPWSMSITATRECLISNASDDNWVHAEAAVHKSDAVLVRLSRRFGFDPDDRPAYRLRFRNPALERLGADRISAAWEIGGDEAVFRLLERTP